jgi:hypothetical protein
VDVRPLEVRDEAALSEFFQAIPHEDRSFFKEDLDETGGPSALDGRRPERQDHWG